MKINYNLIMEEIIKELDKKPKLLLHACCGVCSSAVLERLINHFNITVLFYNPNIYPENEYEKRLKTQKEIIEKMKIDVKIIEIGHQAKDFEKIAKNLETEKE